MRFDSPFFEALHEAIRFHGGLLNAHLHLDRAGTLGDGTAAGIPVALEDASHLSIGAKHALIPRIHAGGAYEPGVLEARVHGWMDRLVAAGTRRADTVVDVTDDGVGLGALGVLLRVKRARVSEIDLRVGAYSPLGFADREPRRWALLEEGAASADFVGSLPERDDSRDYPDHIGFGEHCRRILALAGRLGKPVHLHVDQRNEPSEEGALAVLDALEAQAGPVPDPAEPWVWLVHLISPSTYSEPRFEALVARMVRLGVGVICCPSAAISMRQLRPIPTPTGNSIARVLELLAAGVPVRVGSDNLCDITSPAGTPDLLPELFVLCNAIRFYDIGILAKLAAGVPLDGADRERIRRHLAANAEEVERAVRRSASERSS